MDLDKYKNVSQEYLNAVLRIRTKTDVIANTVAVAFIATHFILKNRNHMFVTCTKITTNLLNKY